MTENIDISPVATTCECMAFIVGPNHFQNALFAAYLTAHSTWKSSVVDGTAALLACGEDAPSCRRAALYDCLGICGGHLPDSLLADLERLPTEWTLVLFNLERQAGVERSALELGVQGFFYRDDTVETLIRGLTAVLGGEFWVSRQKMAEVMLERGIALRRKRIHGLDVNHGLTRREVEILGLLNLGANTKVISEKLFISPHTVRTHLNHIFRKINVTNRLEATLWAANNIFIHKHD